MKHAWYRTHAWPRRFTALGFLALLVLAGRAGIAVLAGSLSATRLLGALRLADPLAALEVSLARRALEPALLAGAGLLVALALVLGPVFCGWLCPLGLLLELQQALRARLSGPRRAQLGHERRPLPRGTRSFLLGLTLALSLTLRYPVFQSVSPILALASSLALALTPALLLVLPLLVLEWRWPRLHCKSLCPAGALYAWIGAKAPLRIRIDPALAGRTPCRQCTLHCPMGIRVMEDYTLAGRTSVDHPDCTRCGACSDACPSGVLRLAFRSRSARTALPLSACGPEASRGSVCA